MNSSNISTISPVKTELDERKKENQSFSTMLLLFFDEEPQFEIKLAKPQTAQGFYGKEKIVNKSYITVDV
ncbi:hypothetical protein [Pseudalkalibacillus decolorationis]|uniref:hypothetical protein n=1 Tax=Pseudalkalibacillus decolorationis TaxID=163879 RepID=UPI0021491446|nr:hypothetical protein [Pseudalkalibacillus decolorationis]